MISKLRILFFLGVAFCLFTGFVVLQSDNFPIPNGFKNMLFYVQRSINKNTIVYELNLNSRDEIDLIEPIKMFWVNYEKGNEIEPLNYIQKKYAYGLNFHVIDAEKKSFYFNFVSYKKKNLYLINSVQDKKYHIFYYKENALVMVERIYVHIEGGSFWTPKVKYIQIFGRDPIKNEPVLEKIIP